MTDTLWNHDLVRFLTFRSSFGPMQFLIILVVLVILVGNIDTVIPHAYTWPISLWLGLCLQSARLRDARITRWLIVLSLFIPLLLTLTMPDAFAFWADVAPKSLTGWVLFEQDFLIPVMKTTIRHIVFQIWAILYLLLLIFAPSRLQSDKNRRD
jgi:hypothetical protein